MPRCAPVPPPTKCQLDVSGARRSHDAIVVGAGHNGLISAPHFAIGAIVWAEIYLSRELVWGRRMCKATVVERPFFLPERRRATPPADF